MPTLSWRPLRLLVIMAACLILVCTAQAVNLPENVSDSLPVDSS